MFSDCVPHQVPSSRSRIPMCIRTVPSAVHTSSKTTGLNASVNVVHQRPRPQRRRRPSRMTRLMTLGSQSLELNSHCSKLIDDSLLSYADLSSIYRRPILMGIACGFDIGSQRTPLGHHESFSALCREHPVRRTDLKFVTARRRGRAGRARPGRCGRCPRVGECVEGARGRSAAIETE